MDGQREHKAADKQEDKDKKDLREEYNKLKEKYSIPDYDALNKDFEIDGIDSDENILREIIREMYERIDFYARILENLVQPDTKLSDMKEAGNLNEEDQQVIDILYKQCMLINRNLLLANLDYSHENAAKEITETHKAWQHIKKDLKLILTKMRDTWKQETKKDNAYGGYYG